MAHGRCRGNEWFSSAATVPPVEHEEATREVRAMSELLKGKRVAFLAATEGVEQIELTDPWDAVRSEHAEPSLVSLELGTIQAFNHLDRDDVFDVDDTVESASSSDYDALVLPGGVANPDLLRMNPPHEQSRCGICPRFLRRGKTCRGDLPRAVDARRG